MNYKRLISSHLPNMPHRSSGNSGAVVALLTGLAVGAVLGVLFAPDSGKKTREKISDKASDLKDEAKDGLTSAKNRVVDEARSKANAVSKEFKDFKDTEIEKAKSGAKRAADDLNDDIQAI
jgi:gas vesicle protein